MATGTRPATPDDFPTPKLTGAAADLRDEKLRLETKRSGTVPCRIPGCLVLLPKFTGRSVCIFHSR